MAQRHFHVFFQKQPDRVLGQGGNTDEVPRVSTGRYYMYLRVCPVGVVRVCKGL